MKSTKGLTRNVHSMHQRLWISFVLPERISARCNRFALGSHPIFLWWILRPTSFLHTFPQLLHLDDSRLWFECNYIQMLDCCEHLWSLFFLLDMVFKFKLIFDYDPDIFSLSVYEIGFFCSISFHVVMVLGLLPTYPHCFTFVWMKKSHLLDHSINLLISLCNCSYFLLLLLLLLLLLQFLVQTSLRVSRTTCRSVHHTKTKKLGAVCCPHIQKCMFYMRTVTFYLL